MNKYEKDFVTAIVADIDEVLTTTDINMDNLELRFGLLDVKFQLKNLIEYAEAIERQE